MKIKPPLLLIPVFAFLVSITPFVARTQPSGQCKTIRDDIANLENQVATLEKEKGNALSDDELEASRTVMSQLNKLIANLQNNPFTNPGKGKTDKEYLKELLIDFLLEENYNNNQAYLETALAKDVDQNGKLLDSRPVNTVNSLKQIRDGLVQAINTAKAKDNREQIEEKIGDLKNKIRSGQQRLAALNCGDKKPAEDEGGDARTQCERNEKRIGELKLELQGLANNQNQIGIWSDEKLARAKATKTTTQRLLTELSQFPAIRKDGRKQNMNDLRDIDMQLVPIVSVYGDYNKYLEAYRSDVRGDKMVGNRMEKTIWFVESLIYNIESQISDATRERNNNQNAIALEKQINDVNAQINACRTKMEQLKCKQFITAAVKKEETKPETKPEKKEEPVGTYSNPDLPATIDLTENFETYGTFTITLKRKSGTIEYEGIYNNGKKGVFRLTTYHDNIFVLQRDYYADIAYTQKYMGNYNGGSASGTIIRGGTFTAKLH